MRKIFSFIAFSLAYLLSANCRAAAPDCPRDILILPMIDKAAVVLFGEIHGTREAPAFVGDIACLLLARGESVQLALEIDRNEQAGLDRYLRSAGASNDIAQLIASPHWQIRDGRATLAMLGLIERVRQWVSAGHKIRLIAMDDFSTSGNIRDREMAAAVDRAAAVGAGKVLVLSGNVHAMRVADHSFLKFSLPAGSLLKTRSVLSFNAAYDGGTANTWGKLIRLAPEIAPPAGGRQFVMGAGAEPAYDGYFFVGVATPSPHVAEKLDELVAAISSESR
jgi:hypothetical protein